MPDSEKDDTDLEVNELEEEVEVKSDEQQHKREVGEGIGGIGGIGGSEGRRAFFSSSQLEAELHWMIIGGCLLNVATKV